MLDQIPTEVTNHRKALTVGVSSSDLLGSPGKLCLVQAANPSESFLITRTVGL